MIEVGGKQFRTLADKFYVNGKQVLKAEVDGSVVYPDQNSGCITQVQLVYVARAEINISQGASYVVIDWGDGETSEMLPRTYYPGSLSHNYDNFENAEANIVTITTYSDLQGHPAQINIYEKFLGLNRNENIDIIKNSYLSRYLWYRENRPNFWKSMVQSYGGCCFGQWYNILGNATLYPTLWIEDPWDISPNGMIYPGHIHERLPYHYECDMDLMTVKTVRD